MSDLIYRQAAIEYLIANMTWYSEEGYEAEEAEKEQAIKELIEGVPSAERWIPCSERLPEEGQRVLIQMENGYMTIIDFSAVGETRHIRVWMPLPEPWKGENNG